MVEEGFSRDGKDRICQRDGTVRARFLDGEGTISARGSLDSTV